MSDGFVAINEKWEYTFVNKKAALLFNKRPEELIGKSLWSIFPKIRTPFHKAYYNNENKKEIIIEDYFFPWNAGSKIG
jgi:PAS domain-containing protein